MPDDEAISTLTPEATLSLGLSASAVAFRGPVFCSQDPAMWFSILECSFKASSTTKSLTKFNHAVSLIPANYLSQVSDVLSAAINSDEPYEDLKSAVLTRLQTSAATRLQELLTKEELGNEKPTNLLLRMKKLLGDKYSSFDQDVFKQLYYQRLPATIQSNLFSVKSKLDIDELAKLADEFMSTVPSTLPINKVSIKPDHDQLTSLVSNLSLQVDALRKELNEQRRSRSRSRQRYRSTTPEGRESTPNRDSSFCYYHRRFAERAKKCQQPCTFAATGNNQPATLNTTGER